MTFVEIPVQTLSPAALHGLVEEFVTREGTDYGEHECSLEDKIQAVIRQLNTGEVVIVFDPDSETCNIITKEELTRTEVRN